MVRYGTAKPTPPLVSQIRPSPPTRGSNRDTKAPSWSPGGRHRARLVDGRTGCGAGRENRQHRNGCVAVAAHRSFREEYAGIFWWRDDLQEISDPLSVLSWGQQQWINLQHDSAPFPPGRQTRIDWRGLVNSDDPNSKTLKPSLPLEQRIRTTGFVRKARSDNLTNRSYLSCPFPSGFTSFTSPPVSDFHRVLVNPPTAVVSPSSLHHSHP
jgi:hypothetical protein